MTTGRRESPSAFDAAKSDSQSMVVGGYLCAMTRNESDGAPTDMDLV